jgi:hypothetical protein
MNNALVSIALKKKNGSNLNNTNIHLIRKEINGRLSYGPMLQIHLE